MKERIPKIELDRELVRAYASTFIPRTDIYSIQTATGKRKGTYFTVKEPLTLEQVADHLKAIPGHSPTLGAYALDPQSQAKWICFDADIQEEWQSLINLAAELTKASQTGYLETSHRGGHLWLFILQTDGKTTRQFAKVLLTHHQISVKEIFPKQDQLTTGCGSLVRLPLGIHLKTNRRYHFIKPDQTPLAPTIREQIALLASPTLIDPAFISHILATIPLTPERPQPRSFKSSHSPTDTTPPLSQAIKNTTSLRDFIEQHVALNPKGMGRCPFHDDHHESFGVAINEDGQEYWHCFACDFGGDLIHFWRRMRAKNHQDDSFKTTLHELAKMVL